MIAIQGVDIELIGHGRFPEYPSSGALGSYSKDRKDKDDIIHVPVVILA